MPSTPNLLLRLCREPGQSWTARLPEFLADNEEEFDGQHAEWTAALIADGEVVLAGGATPIVQVAVIDPAEETHDEITARDRARVSRPLCPQCAGRGQRYAGPEWFPGIPRLALTSREMAEKQALELKGPFAPCSLGCKTPEAIYAEATEITARIVARRTRKAA